MSGAVHLSVDPALHDELVTATVDLSVAGEPMQLSLTIPAGRTTAEEMLPVLHGLTSLFVDRSVGAVERAGKSISCRAGCGACCRQMVPISGAEARQLARLVAAMPPLRRAAVRKRFAAALAALDAAGLLERLRDSSKITPRDQGIAYLRLGIPCPFLENEACSIHPVRPMACREYLVTSPAENCAATRNRRVEVVPLDWEVSNSVKQVPAAESWLPLVLALRFAERAGRPRKETGPALLSAVFNAPRGAALPPAKGDAAPA